MPTASPFTIETPSNSLRLNGSRRAQATFTVYNASGRAQRVRAMVVTEPPEVRRWLTLTGEEYRQFPVAGTESYAVDITVPPEGAAGNYTLRLDVQGEDDPDRSHVQGPPVSFEVQAPEPPPPPSKFPRWLLPVLGLVVVAAAFFILRPRDVLVPDVNGQELVSGLNLLVDAGLQVAQPLTQRTSSSVDELHIIGTVPPTGESVARGSEIEVLVSTGPGEIVCVRFPCDPFDVIDDQVVKEFIRVEPDPIGEPQLFFDMNLLQENP